MSATRVAAAFLVVTLGLATAAYAANPIACDMEAYFTCDLSIEGQKKCFRTDLEVTLFINLGARTYTICSSLMPRCHTYSADIEKHHDLTIVRTTAGQYLKIGWLNETDYAEVTLIPRYPQLSFGKCFEADLPETKPGE